MKDPAELALKCFDGDTQKAEALLELLNISMDMPASMPDVKMKLPEDSRCEWEHNGECWKDIPDSCLKCKIPCTFFKPVVQ